VEFDKLGNATHIVEKDPHPSSNYAVTGLYFYPKGVANKAKQVTPSKRGELEITDLNNLYLQEGNLHVTTLGRGYSWLDTGTQESLVDASNFVKTIEDHEGLKICCPEEIAYNKGWISKEDLLKAGEMMKKNEYGQHLLNVANGKIIY
jgi:glucose-1-phosphate thymidylyltransferase